MKLPSVSIIIPTYNRANLIEAALQSAVNQTYKNLIEIIVVDDASTDNTEEVIKRWQKRDKKIIYIKNKQNLKCLGARIEGYKIAKGEWLANLDSDDILTPNSIKSRISVVQKSPVKRLGLVWGKIRIFPLIGDSFICSFVEIRNDFYKNALKRLSWCAALSMMVKRECFNLYGYPDARVRPEDDETCLFLFSKGYGTDFTNEVVAEIRESPRQGMQNDKKAYAIGREFIFRKYKDEMEREVGRKYVRLNYIRLIYCFALADEWKSVQKILKEMAPDNILSALVFSPLLKLISGHMFLKRKTLKYLNKYITLALNDRSIFMALRRKISPLKNKRESNFESV